MNGRTRQQERNTGYGRRNDYDAGYDERNYGRRFEGDRVFEGQQRSTSSEYPEYMDQDNSYNNPTRAPGSRMSSESERYGSSQGRMGRESRSTQDWGRRSSQGDYGMDDWSPANGTDYRASSFSDDDRGRAMNRDYDQYSRGTGGGYSAQGRYDDQRSHQDQRSYEHTSNRGYNQGFGQSYGMGYGETYGSSQGLRGGGRDYQGRDESSWGMRRDYGQRDWERSSQQQSQGRFSGVAPKGYRRSDERIKEELNDALTQDPHVDASEIDVAVENGVVTLKGTVGERRMKRMAEDCAERVRGVSDVRNELRVQTESSTSSMKKTSSDTMGTSADGRSSEKSDSESSVTRGGKTSSRTSSTEARNYQS